MNLRRCYMENLIPSKNLLVARRNDLPCPGNKSQVRSDYILFVIVTSSHYK